MADLFVTLFLIGFFGLCLGYVRACDWIIGPDSENLPADEAVGDPDRDPAPR